MPIPVTCSLSFLNAHCSQSLPASNARRGRVSPLFFQFDGSIKRSRRPQAAACHEFGLHAGPSKHDAPVLAGPVCSRGPPHVFQRSTTLLEHPNLAHIIDKPQRAFHWIQQSPTSMIGRRLRAEVSRDNHHCHRFANNEQEVHPRPRCTPINLRRINIDSSLVFQDAFPISPSGLA
ncbi:hypothetical protein N431DRAFT_431727 [Stipitochalara longipes BDJ]|nr:hypothetical protein N431DRAFT_431727 [Stipitochalara longipes BDJ]